VRLHPQRPAARSRVFRHRPSARSPVLSADGKTVISLGKRPTNQNSPKVQRKIAARLSKINLTKHNKVTPEGRFIKKFVKQVNEKGKANLENEQMQIAHITSVDTQGETLREVVNQRNRLTPEQKEDVEAMVEDAISSDAETDRQENKRRVRNIWSENTEQAARGVRDVLERLNQSSRNLRPAHARTNASIGKRKDPFVLNKREDARSKGINDNFNKVRQHVGLPPDQPKTNLMGEVQSSSVSSIPKNAFTKIVEVVEFFVK
jgi:hypothetical protein